MVSVGRENGVSLGTIGNGASKDLILVYTVQLKQVIKAHFSGKLVSSGSKTRLKKLMMMIMIIIVIVTEKNIY